MKKFCGTCGKFPEVLGSFCDNVGLICKWPNAEALLREKKCGTYGNFVEILGSLAEILGSLAKYISAEAVLGEKFS